VSKKKILIPQILLDIALLYLSREIAHTRSSFRCGTQLVGAVFGWNMFVLIEVWVWVYSISVHFGLESSLGVHVV